MLSSLRKKIIPHFFARKCENANFREKVCKYKRILFTFSRAGNSFYLIKLLGHIYMSDIAGETAGPNGLRGSIGQKNSKFLFFCKI